MNFKLISLFLLITVCSLPVQAKMFKWKDSEGNTHFGDKIPDEYLNKEHKELSAQGAIMEAHEEVKIETAEEKKEKLRLERIKKAEQLKADALAKEQAKQDRVLLDTYTTEDDLTAALDARLDAVDSQLQLSESITADAKSKLDVTAKQIDALTGSNKAIPQNIKDKMKREEKQLKTYLRLAEGHHKRKDAINLQFDTYLKRFRVLKANKKRIRDAYEARQKEALEN